MASSSVTTPEAEATRPTSRDLAGRGFAAILFAIVAVAVGRGVAGALLGVPNEFRPLSWAVLVGVATLAGVGASLAFSVLVRLTDRPERWFLVLAGVVLACSFVPLVVVGPTVPGATTELLAVLAAMHVAAAVGVSAPLVGWPAPRSQVGAASTEE